MAYDSPQDIIVKPRAGAPCPELRFNPDDYRRDLKELDLTPQQEDELLGALWHIMSMMVDMGWGLDATHLVLQKIFEDSGK